MISRNDGWQRCCRLKPMSLVSGWCLGRKITQEKKEERKGEFVNWHYNTETGPLYTRDQEAITNLLSRSNRGEMGEVGKSKSKGQT